MGREESFTSSKIAAPQIYTSGTSPNCFSETVIKFSSCALLETSVFTKMTLLDPCCLMKSSASGVSFRSAIMILAPSLIAVERC